MVPKLESNEYAYFDALAICTRMEAHLEGVSKQEIYLFAYLACLLSLYKNRPVASWGYLFAVTDYAYPYSSALDNTVRLLLTQALLIEQNGSFELTSEGKLEYQTIRSMSVFSEREPFIDGACASILALPVGVIRTALSNQPDVRGAISLEQSRMLLSESGLEVLHDQFSSLSMAIGVDVKDLIVPAVVWLTYLTQVQQRA